MLKGEAVLVLQVGATLVVVETIKNEAAWQPHPVVITSTYQILVTLRELRRPQRLLLIQPFQPNSAPLMRPTPQQYRSVANSQMVGYEQLSLSDPLRPLISFFYAPRFSP